MPPPRANRGNPRWRFGLVWLRRRPDVAFGEECPILAFHTLLRNKAMTQELTNSGHRGEHPLSLRAGVVSHAEMARVVTSDSAALMCHEASH